MEHIFGILSLIFSLSAYYQLQRKKFLILNGLAILFIGLSFYIKGGMVGAYTEAVMLTIHIIAYITTLEFQRKISILAPLISFSIFFTLTNTQFQVIPFLARKLSH